jgi:hypothetical protein
MGLEFNFESCSLLNSWVIGLNTLIWIFNLGKFLVHNLSLIMRIDLGCKGGTVLIQTMGFLRKLATNRLFIKFSFDECSVGF